MSKAKSSGTQSGTGGGARVTQGRVSGGSPKTNAMTPEVAAQIGRQVVRTKPAPMAMPKAEPIQLGNRLATNVGKGSPGAGREVHRCGTQGRHGGSDGDE